jgi:hypothetical protein
MRCITGKRIIGDQRGMNRGRGKGLVKERKGEGNDGLGKRRG